MQFPLKIFSSSRKIQFHLILIITITFLFLISVNYSGYVKTKAYEIYIKFDKSSISVYMHSNASDLCPLLPQHLNKSK